MDGNLSFILKYISKNRMRKAFKSAAFSELAGNFLKTSNFSKALISQAQLKSDIEVFCVFTYIKSKWNAK